MHKDDTGNFAENIHLVDYESRYYEKQVGAESLICDYYRIRESLGGDWNFGIDQYDNCLRSRWTDEVYADPEGRPYPMDFSFDAWETVPVPSCWNTQRERFFLYEGSCVYTRTFSFEARTGERVFLRFGAAHYDAKVFLNKQYIGMHTGGGTPFYFEVGGLLQPDNRLVVVVNNTRKRDGVPCDNTDWFNYGGLHREVELMRLSQTFIRDFFISLVSDGTYKNISAAVQVDGDAKDGTAVLNIPTLNIRVEIPVKDGFGEAIFKAAPRLWSPESPHLYDMTVSYGEDTLVERVGFREIAVKDGRILLNGREIFLRGICAHEESVINGRSVSREEIRENIALSKELNCNYMRLAHYPHHETAARMADEAGIMLWEEIPVYWAIDFENALTYQNAENQLTELIKRDRNRCSVIIWSVGNENADTDDRLKFMSDLVRAARGLDPTRLVSAACLVDHVSMKIADRLADNLDVIGINEYYGWYDPDFTKLPRIFENSKCNKPVIICEFGADAKAGERGAPNLLHTEEHQRAVYERQLKILDGIPYVKGISPWILFDFRCPRRLHVTQNYYNIKGLLSADKRYKKPAFFVMQDYYAKKKIL